MKTTLNWLKDYVAVSGSPEALAHKLTMAGLEVENIASVDGDTVFEFEITPNRPDCLSVLGIAREVSAIYNLPLKFPKMKKGNFPKRKCDITILDKKGCSRYIGTIIKGVGVTESPRWLQDRLKAVGLRPINNVVDLTNYCLMEIGQPLHAFDYDKLMGGKIIVRRAKEGEKLIALDEKEYVLDPSSLVIADAKRPVAVAGIMGGVETAVTEKTTNILLESAYFDPALIRRATRRLGLTSDSSYRFERNVDFQGVETGAHRAVSLILELAGGILEARQDVGLGKQKRSPATIEVALEDIHRLWGVSVSVSRCANILRKLGCEVTTKKKGILRIVPPSFRADLKREVDIIEEIARIVGYDEVPSSLPAIKVEQIRENEKRRLRGALYDVLLAQGLNEAITYTMTSRWVLEKSRLDPSAAPKIQNPLTQDLEVMTPSLLPGLLSAVQFNANREQKNIRLFEIGKTYSRSGEKEALGVILTGMRRDDWRLTQKEEVNFFDLKGVVEKILKKSKVQATWTNEPQDFFEPGEDATLKIGSHPLGILGRLSGEILDAWDIKQKNVFYAEIDCDVLFRHASLERRYQPISEFPAVVRDISLAIPEDVPFERIQTIIKELKPSFFVDLKLNEEYRGEKILPGQRGISFSLVYQSWERTLREEEIAAAHERISQALVERLPAVRR